MKTAHIVMILATVTALTAPWSRAETDPAAEKQEAYLGVATSALPPSMAPHLDLLEGAGLVIEYIDPESAANDVLRKDDILEKFEDQIVMDTRQLAILTRGKQPGETVKLTVIRDGERIPVEAILGARPAGLTLPPPAGGVFGEGAMTLPTPAPFRFRQTGMRPEDLKGLQAQARKLQDHALQLQEKAARLKSSGNLEAHVAELQRQAEQLNRLGESFLHMEPPRIELETHAHGERNQTISVVKNGLMLTLMRTGEHEHVRAMKTDGTVLFDGPTDTEDQRQKMPDEVKEWYESLEKAPVQVKTTPIVS